LKYYVAAKFEDRARAKQVIDALIAAGHTVTYDWTQCIQCSVEQAQLDKDGVMAADALVFLAGWKIRDLPYLGALVEFGIAVARGIPIYLLGDSIDLRIPKHGPPTGCIFTVLPEVIHTTVEEFLKGLEGLA